MPTWDSDPIVTSPAQSSPASQPQSSWQNDPVLHPPQQQQTPAPQAPQQPNPVAGLPQENSGVANFAASVLGSVNPLANFAIRGMNAAGLVSDQRAQAAMAYNPFPSDQSRMSGFAGGVTGQMLQAVAAPAAAPAIFGVTGGEQAMEDVEALRRAGVPVTAGQALTDVAAQTALQFLAGKLAPGGAVNKVLLARLTPEALPVVAQAIMRQAITAGVHLPEGMALQLANNAITKYGGPGGQGVNPQQQMGQGVVQAGVANAAGAGVAQGLHDTAAMTAGHPLVQPTPAGSWQQDPVVQNIPAPSPDALKGIQYGTPEANPPAGPQNVETPGKGVGTPEVQPTPQPRPLLDAAQPKYRVTNGAESAGVGLNFESPEDKALYLATVPRKGKVANEAVAYLQELGYKPADIDRYGDSLRERIEGLARQSHTEGRDLDVPMLGREEAGTTEETGLPAEQGGGNEHEESRPVDKRIGELVGARAEREAVPQEQMTTGERRVLESMQNSDALRDKQENPKTEWQPQQEKLDQYTPGAKAVDPNTLSRDHQSVLADYKALTGKDMIPYSGGKGRGFHVDGDAYYNVERNNTPQLRREVMAHEATHYLQDTKPELVRQMDQAIPENVRKELLNEYQRSYTRQEGKALSTEHHNREIQAMAVGRAFSRPGVARAVMENNPGVFSRAANAVMTKLRGLTSRGRATNEIINFLRTAKAQADSRYEGEPTSRHAPEQDAANFLPQHNERIRDEAEEYATKAGIPYQPTTDYATVNTDRAKQIGAEYDAMKHEPANPDVAKSYAALKRETMDQYNYLKDQGVNFEPWNKPGQPYADSAEMMQDARDNKHLYFYQGGDMPADHPLADKAPGTPYSYNDIFRAVHDYFGHAKEGNGFGPRGEENAWRQHSAMYSDEARPAMTTETRGQNSWVNYGPHGEHNQANPKDTIYAEQKAGLLSPKHNEVERPSFLPDEEEKQPLPYKARGKIQADAYKDFNKYLTGDELASMSENDAKKAAQVYKTLPPVKEFVEAAKAGVAAKGWYEDSRKTLRSVFGKDANRFVALLAADSPRQSVQENLREASRVWKAWNEAGRPTDPAKIQAVLNEPVETGNKDLFGNAETEKAVGMKGRIPNIVRALSDPSGTLSGYKVDSFKGNLTGDANRSTNDTWMATFAGIDQKDFSSNGGYLGYTAMIRKAADQLGWKPENVQETVWSLTKTLAEAGGGAEKLRTLTHERVAQTPAFHNLLNDPEVKANLTAAGYAVPDDGGRGAERPTGRVVSRLSPELRRIAERTADYAGRSAQPEGEALFLPGQAAAKTFLNDDVKPGLKALAESFSSAWDGIKSVFAPQARSEGAGVAARLLRERGGTLARLTDRVNHEFDATEDAVGKLPVDMQHGITDAAERGQINTLPSELQPVATALRSMYQDRLGQLQKLDPTFEGIQNYMGHAYKDPNKAVDVLQGLARRPLEGNKGFLKERTMPYQSDAIAAGLEPVTDNPVTMMKLKIGQMDKYIATRNAFDELRGQGLVKKIPARSLYDMQDKGYAQIDDKIGTIMAKPNRRGGISIAGYWMAPEPVARVINNYLSPGIRGSERFGNAYRTYLGVGHLMNSVQLLSGFHLAFSTIDTMASKLGLSFKQLGAGDFAGAGKSAASWASIVHPVIDAYRNGSAMMKEWYKPGSSGRPDAAQAVEAYMIAGGRAHMGDELPSFSESMKQKYQQGNLVGAGIRAIPALIEKASAPLMEHLIPRLKMGVFYDMAMHEIEQLPPGAGRDAYRKVMGKAQDSVDDRLGEMVYDNTFWDHTAKDTLMALTRSVGWNAGTFRTFGGAAADVAKIPGQIKAGGLKGIQFSNRMAYSLAVPLTTALVGGIIHYASTGQAPQNLKDLMFPKTGRKDKNGDDERFAIPSYVKDLYEYGHDVSDAVKQSNPALAVRTLSHKVNPVLSSTLEMLQNKDYYNTKIRNEDDPIYKQLADTGKYGARQFTPFASRAIENMTKEGQGARALLPLVGFNPARKDITESPAALKAQELMQARMPVGTRTQEQANKSEMHADIASQLRGKTTTQQGDILRPLVQSGQLGPAEAKMLQANARYGTSLERNVHHLGLEDSMKVFDVATDDEKGKLVPQLLAKVRSSKSATPAERKQYLSTLFAEWKRIKGGSVPATPDEE